jgi:hypothetical protein
VVVVGQVLRVPFKVLDALRQPATGKTVLVTARDPTGAVRVNAETADEIANGDYDYPILLDREGVWIVDGDCVEVNFHESRAIIVGAVKAASVKTSIPYNRKFNNSATSVVINNFVFLYYDGNSNGRLDKLTYPELEYFDDNSPGGDYTEKALVTDGTYLYLTANFGAYGIKVYKIDPATLSTVGTWTSPTTYCFRGYLATDGTYIYCAYGDSDAALMYVAKIETTGMTTDDLWTSSAGQTEPYALVYGGSYVYVAAYEDPDSRIIKIDPSTMNTSDTTAGTFPVNALAADANYVYAAVNEKAPSDMILKINASTMATDDSWSDGFFYVVALALDGDFLYALAEYTAPLIKINTATMDNVSTWQGDPLETGSSITVDEDYLFIGIDPTLLYAIPKITLPERSLNQVAVPYGYGNKTISDVIGNKEDPAVYSPGSDYSLMSYVKGAVATPFQQQDLSLQQASPNQSQYYAIGGGVSGKVSLQSVSVRVASTGETLQVQIATNFGTFYASAACTADTDYYLHKVLGTDGVAADGMRFRLDTVEGPILEGGMPISSLTISVEKTTNNGTGTLYGRVGYAYVST